MRRGDLKNLRSTLPQALFWLVDLKRGVLFLISESLANHVFDHLFKVLRIKPRFTFDSFEDLSPLAARNEALFREDLRCHAQVLGYARINIHAKDPEHDSNEP